ncbi:MAG: LytTR family DNA-binding domain-containing protein [Pseudooceanicola sp.]
MSCEFVNSEQPRFAMREFLADFVTLRRGIVLVGAIFVLTVLGPFGTYDSLSLPRRVFFWTAMIVSLTFPMHLGMWLCIRAPQLRSWPRPARIMLGSALAALPGTALVYVIDAAIWPPMSDLARFPRTWLQVTVLGFVIGFFHHMPLRLIFGLGHGRGATPSSDGDTAERNDLSRFHRRLSPGLGNDIVSLSMQDHYVEVTTTRGSEMILIRLADAIDELKGTDGMRIHRSHWAAAAHMKELGRENGKLRLRLSDGRHLPVSQTYADDLRRRFPD